MLISAKFWTDKTKVSLLMGLLVNNFIFLLIGIIVKITSKDMTGEIFNITNSIMLRYPI